MSNISNNQLNTEAKKASENKLKSAKSLTWENAKRLFSKTENYHWGHTSFMGWSVAWFAGALKGLGTKTVRISAGTNRSDEVCGSAAFCGVKGHCSAAAVCA